MNMNRKSLGQVLAGFELFSGLVGVKKATTDAATETKEQTTDKADPDADTDKTADKADETKTDGDTEKKTETGKVETTKEASSLQIGNSVSMSLEDYDKLLSMASLAIEATEENKALKAKADRWDAYQAALGGGKPSSDSAGAKADGAKTETVADENAALRQKHGKLMEDI